MLCPRCHNQVPDTEKVCAHCHMLLKFKTKTKKKGLLDFFKDIIFWNIEYDNDLCKQDELNNNYIAEKDYIVGFLYSIDKLMTFLILFILGFIILAFLLGPLIALPFLIFDKSFWGFMLFLVFIMPFAGAVAYRCGKCPYCGEKASGIPKDNAITCKTCKRIIIVKNNHFYKTDV